MSAARRRKLECVFRYAIEEAQKAGVATEGNRGADRNCAGARIRLAMGRCEGCCLGLQADAQSGSGQR
jgi:hypothetical protein